MDSTLGKNIEFPIKNADGSAFHDLVLHKATVDSVVMSLGDKITGEVYYKDNTLAVTMQEYIEYKSVRYVLVNPPTVVREGLVSDNSGLNGMTKYSFEFYHPMYMLGNFPFTDVAVKDDEEQYLAQNKTFSWIGTGLDFIVKLNANLRGTEWVVVASDNEQSLKKLQCLPNDVVHTKSEDNTTNGVLAFDQVFISEALKTMYDTWEVPFVIDSLHEGEYYDEHSVDYYSQGKKFVIVAGLPSNKILDENDQPFVFQFGQGVGLKNNSRTPKNNKIVTRIAPIGSENNIPYGYPQIEWTGNQTWNYTINNASGMQEITVGGETIRAMSYPIYDGILGGRRVKLIKHPFTRTTLMPSVYSDSVNKKVNPLNPNYNPNGQIIDYYDAIDNTYDDGQGGYISFPHNIVQEAPSFEAHQFGDIKPELGEQHINGVYIVDVEKAVVSDFSNYFVVPQAYNEVINSPLFNGFFQADRRKIYDNVQSYLPILLSKAQTQSVESDRVRLLNLHSILTAGTQFNKPFSGSGSNPFTMTVFDGYQSGVTSQRGTFIYVSYQSTTVSIYDMVWAGEQHPQTEWDDTVGDDGDYVQKEFYLQLPQLDFDLYASAAITQAMQINMRSGVCMGCTFEVQVDWEVYKANFYRSDGTFDPEPHVASDDGHVRDLTKFPDSSQGAIDILVQKDNNTFGKLMPNQYQYPKANDRFVVLGISLPTTYITNAEERLDDAALQYMLENNVYHYEYPLKFDEYFLATHTDILAQMRNNTIVRFMYAGLLNVLYIKQITVKYGDKVLPQYDITLTDDVEIVLNQIGQVTDDVSRVRVQMNELQKYYGEDVVKQINENLSRVADDVALGRITFQQGINVIGEALFNGAIQSPNFRQGLYDGGGWKIDALGNAELESLRVRSFMEIVELIVNRMQANEGDTVFAENDQIEYVEEQTVGGVTSYVLTLKEKWNGYVTAQQKGSILKGVINTLSAKQAGVSDYTDTDAVETDGVNTYITSYMQLTETSDTDASLLTNQIRVALYGDAYVPSQKNFKPCELMTIVRIGCYLDPNETGITSAEKQRRQKLQNSFYISTSEGRIVKLNGVDSPIIRNDNFGTTLGELPDFVKQYPAVAERLYEGRDYLYAQGVVVQDFIKIDREGHPEIQYVDCGEWVDGNTAQNPTPRKGVYYHNVYNELTGQYETHDVWRMGHKWRCMNSQPINGVYYEPKFGMSQYWQMIEGNDNYHLDFFSSMGYSFRRGYVDTTIMAKLYYGDNEDITSSVVSWVWTRCSEAAWNGEWEHAVPSAGDNPRQQRWYEKVNNVYTPTSDTSVVSGKTYYTHPVYTQSDVSWNTQHINTTDTLHLTNADMQNDWVGGWSSANKAIFSCKTTLNDGRDIIIVENQIIS